MTPPAGFWTSSPGNWSLMELWTDAHVPVASSASLTGEVPPVLLVRGQEWMRCHLVETQEQEQGGDVGLVQSRFNLRCP